MKPNRIEQAVLAIFALLPALTAGGAPALQQTNNPSGQAMVITSTNGAFFEGNKAVWFGKVLATDGEMDLMCELLTVNLITNSGTRQIESIVAETNVVVAQRESWAFGDRAVYTASNDVVELSAFSGEVILDNPDFYLIAPKVIFDRKTGRSFAPGAITAGGVTRAGASGTNSLGIALPGARRDRSQPSANPPPGRSSGGP
jgi:lipopolysaccharide export system protein LptA